MRKIGILDTTGTLTSKIGHYRGHSELTAVTTNRDFSPSGTKDQLKVNPILKKNQKTRRRLDTIDLQNQKLKMFVSQFESQIGKYQQRNGST
jgi:hypothetical protein